MFKSRVLLVVSGHFIHDCYIGFLPIFIPLLVQSHGLSMTMAGLFIVCYRMPTVFSIPLGYLNDRKNMCLPFVLAPGIVAVILSSFAMLDSLPLAYTAMVAAGLCSCVYHLVGPALLSQKSQRHTLGKYMGLWMLCGEASRFVAPILGALAVGWWGFGQSVWPFVYVGLACSAVLFWGLRGASTLTKAARKPSMRESLHICLPVVLPLLPVIIAQGFLGPALFAYLPSFLVFQGHTLVQGGSGLGLFEACGLCGAFLGGAASDKFGRRALLRACYGASIVLLPALLYAQSIFLYIMLAFLGFFSLMSAPVVMATIMQNIPEEFRGIGNGIYMCANFVCASLGIFCYGLLIDWVGFSGAFATSAALGLCCLFFIQRIKEAPAAKL